MTTICSKWPSNPVFGPSSKDMYDVCDVGDAGDLWQQPSNAVSGSVPKGHVGHLNDLVPIGRGKPVRVKSIYKKGDCHIDCQWLWRSNCHLDYYDCRLDCQSIVNDYEEGAGTSKGLSKRQGHGANSRLQQELRCPDDSVFCPDNSVGKVGSYYSNVFIILIIVTILMIIIIIIIIIIPS